MTASTLYSPVKFEQALPDPSPRLRCCIVVPARNEEESIGPLVDSLRRQVELDGSPMKGDRFEIIVLLNNCTDNTAGVLCQLGSYYPSLSLHFPEINFPVELAHVGRARQLLFDLATRRFTRLSRPGGLILSTDADTIPASDWIAQTEWEIERGVDGVGGRITISPLELANLPERVRRCYLFDIAYRSALEQMKSLYAPETHDPFPRHHQHFGGSIAVTVSAYRFSGGMPLCRSSEDVALYKAVLASGGKFRHSYRVKATTSARLVGRAKGGLADAFNWWKEQTINKEEVSCESALSAETRLATLGLWRVRFPNKSSPPFLFEPPEPPVPGQSEPISLVLNQLRKRNAALRELSLDERLTNALEQLEIAIP